MEPKIERALMNGEGRTVIVQDEPGSPIGWPNGLTIDFDGDRVYWCEARHDRIESAKLDGTDRRLHITDKENLRDPFAITVFGDYLYWTDR